MIKNKYISFWLFTLCGCLFFMVLLGGLTRLTDSGLSIVKWEPLSGALPPAGDKWDYYFSEYQKTSQYQQMNQGMSLEQFKGIFWLEYFHRLMGRLTGLFFVVPFVYFLCRRQLNRGLWQKFTAIFLIGALQGVVGWYMVKSGFVGRSSVSQYMLAFHLGTAFLIYALLFVCALSSSRSGDPALTKLKTGSPASLRMTGVAIVIMVFIMIILGAFMAGTHAGYTYNTFPLMDGKIVPGGLYVMKPWWKNHFENIAMIQFQHRWFAMVTGIVIFGFAFKLAKIGQKRLAVAISASVIIQIALGISTLYAFGNYADYAPATYAYKRVFYTPVIIAALHQLNALVLFSVSLMIWHKFSRQSPRHPQRSWG